MTREDAFYLNPTELKEELKEYAALSFDAMEYLAKVDPQFRFSSEDLHRMIELRRAYLKLIEQASIEALKTTLHRVK